MSNEHHHRRQVAEAESWLFYADRPRGAATVEIRRRSGASCPATAFLIALPPGKAPGAQPLRERLQLMAPGASLSQLDLLVEQAWFGDRIVEQECRVPLHLVLRDIAGRYLRLEGGLARPKWPPPSGPAADASTDPLDAWRSISLRLPADLLVAALASQVAGNSPVVSDDAWLLSPHLERLLNDERGVSETHLHAKAAFRFSELWTSWMARLCRDGVPAAGARKPYEPFKSLGGFIAEITAGALVRLMLGNFLAGRRRGSGTQDAGTSTHAQLKSVVERIERLEEEKKTISDDIRDVYAESKGNGFDVKALRAVVRLRKIETTERNEQQLILETYMNALGMLAA